MSFLSILTRDFVSPAELRKCEKKKLWLINFVHTLNTGFTVLIPIIAIVFTFLVHTLLGFNINTTDVSEMVLQCMM